MPVRLDETQPDDSSSSKASFVCKRGQTYFMAKEFMQKNSCPAKYGQNNYIVKVSFNYMQLYNAEAAADLDIAFEILNFNIDTI